MVSCFALLLVVFGLFGRRRMLLYVYVGLSQHAHSQFVWIAVFVDDPLDSGID